MNISSTPLGFVDFWVFIEQRGGPGGTRGGHNPPGRAWASWRPLVGCAPSGHPPGAARADLVVLDSAVAG